MSDLNDQLNEAARMIEGPDVEGILRYMYAHPYYVPILFACGSWEEKYGKPFKWSDVRVFPKDLNKLVIDGLLTKDGSKYRLRAPDLFRTAFAQYMKEKTLAMMQFHDYSEKRTGEVPVPAGIPPNVFDAIIGYDAVKRRILLALGAKTPVHVLLTGPPSTAKSLFLEAFAQLPGARLTYGDAASKAGLRRFVMEEHPQYLIIDEIDKMKPEDNTILLELMEHQTVSVLHYNENQMEDISLRVFAAANDISKIRPELLSRFDRIQLREYTPEEFVRVAYNHLVKKMGVDEHIAAYIAKGVAQKSRDIRDAIRIANMSKRMEDAIFLVSSLGQIAQV